MRQKILIKMLIFFIEMSILNFLIEREIDQKREISEYINYNNNTCNNDHKYGYSPHVKHGTCRYCWKREPLTFQDFIHIKSK